MFIATTSLKFTSDFIIHHQLIHSNSHYHKYIPQYILLKGVLKKYSSIHVCYWTVVVLVARKDSGKAWFFVSHQSANFVVGAWSEDANKTFPVTVFLSKMSLCRVSLRIPAKMACCYSMMASKYIYRASISMLLPWLVQLNFMKED